MPIVSPRAAASVTCVPSNHGAEPSPLRTSPTIWSSGGGGGCARLPQPQIARAAIATRRIGRYLAPSHVPLPIVAFAKDWNEDPTSNHHVLRELAKTRRVLWLNSIATRTPSLASGRNLGKIRRKLAEFARGPVNVENDLWVTTPLVLPLPGSAIARAINRQILRATIRALRLRLGIKQFELWTFLPNTADYIGTLGEDLAVYYCVDEWSLFS